MKTTIKYTLALALICLFLTSYGKNKKKLKFKAIADIATFHGNLKSNTVIITAQGGPFTSLQDETLNEFIELAQAESALFVNVHQEQTKNPDIFKNSDITFEQAKQYNKKSIAYLKRVVDYFKHQKKKKIYMLGISFGSFVTQEFIATYGINAVDGYLIVAGRLDIDKDTWVPFSRGENTTYLYDENGDYAIKSIGKANTAEARNMARLAAGLGFNRYTEKFKSISDLSKITYIYGNRDDAVGRLSTKEIKFLKSKGVKVGVSKGGKHGDAISTGLSLLPHILNI